MVRDVMTSVAQYGTRLHVTAPAKLYMRRRALLVCLAPGPRAQRHFTEHPADVVGVATHPETGVVATGRCAGATCRYGLGHWVLGDVVRASEGTIGAVPLPWHFRRLGLRSLPGNCRLR